MRATPSTSDRYTEFKSGIYMPAAELERWLKTAEPNSIGQNSGLIERIEHQTGEQVICTPHRKKADITPGDAAHLHKASASMSCHSAQRPPGDIGHLCWRYSRMNWSYDLLK
jgi:hypothetical protein